MVNSGDVVIEAGKTWADYCLAVGKEFRTQIKVLAWSANTWDGMNCMRELARKIGLNLEAAAVGTDERGGR
jgi:hypothetical protein